MPATSYQLPATSLRVLGIDPGYERLGVAVLERNGSNSELLFSDCLQTKRGDEFTSRLGKLGASIETILEKWQPQYFAVEKLFFSTNQKTALGVAEVKGMLRYLAYKHKLEYHECTPLQVKIAITSYGRADKRQVTEMLHRLLAIEKKIRFDDEYDAIAVGLTCLATLSGGNRGGTSA